MHSNSIVLSHVCSSAAAPVSSCSQRCCYAACAPGGRCCAMGSKLNAVGDGQLRLVDTCAAFHSLCSCINLMLAVTLVGL